MERAGLERATLRGGCRGLSRRTGSFKGELESLEGRREAPRVGSRQHTHSFRILAFCLLLAPIFCRSAVAPSCLLVWEEEAWGRGVLPPLPP